MSSAYIVTSTSILSITELSKSEKTSASSTSKLSTSMLSTSGKHCPVFLAKLLKKKKLNPVQKSTRKKAKNVCFDPDLFSDNENSADIFSALLNNGSFPKTNYFTVGINYDFLLIEDESN